MLPNLINDIERDLSLEQALEAYEVKPAKMQTDSQRLTRYFCPLHRCQGDTLPHFVIYTNDLRDRYGHTIAQDQRTNKDVLRLRRWRCEHSRIEGYGTVSLVSAILGYNSDITQLTREQVVCVLSRCAELSGKPTVALEDKNSNGYLSTFAPQTRWIIKLSDKITPEAFTTLALNGMDGIPADKVIDILHRDLGLWQVEKYDTAGQLPVGDRQAPDGFKTYERRAHCLFPIFAFCYDYETGLPLTENPEKRTEPWVARIVMPNFVRRSGEDFDWRNDFWVLMNADSQEDLYEWFHAKTRVFGDLAAMEVIRTRDAQKTADRIGEEIRQEKEIMEEVDDGKKTKVEIVYKDLEADEKRLQKCVLCRNPLDAVCLYLWLNYPRLRFTGKDGKCSSTKYANDFWHCAWLQGVEQALNPFESSELHSVADETFELFGNDRAEISAANNNALRHNYLRMCMLPSAMSEMRPVDNGSGIMLAPHSPRDFFRYYEPTTDEQVRNMLVVGKMSGVKALMIQKELNASSELRPFTRNDKKKKTAGQKAYDYSVNMAVAWQTMKHRGYFRSIAPGDRSTIGQCYRVDGHFIYDLDPESVMADMAQCLDTYAKDSATDVADGELMQNAILHCKDLQYTKNITRMPLLKLPSCESYGPELDYFFFRNGALEITPTAIRFRDYSELDFQVYRSMVKDFDYVQPFFGKRDPISIGLNPEYVTRLKAYEDARREGKLTDSELLAMKQSLKDFASVNQWLIKIKPTEDYDPRIVVPNSIRDGRNNEWLKWWPCLRMLRCWANQEWQREEQQGLNESELRVLSARMANIMFAIGRCLYRYRDGRVQYMPYFLENDVDREGKAQGGSGKSLLVNGLLPYARYVCTVDGRNISGGDDIAKLFSGFKYRRDTLVHIEDMTRNGLDALYNYASSGFRVKNLYSDPITIPREEAPIIAITSNYMVQGTDESSLGRVLFGGLSHYFQREVTELGKMGRTPDTIYPDLCADPHDATDEERGRIIWMLAKCVQFCMVATNMGCKVASPGSEMLERLDRSEMGDVLYDFFTDFFGYDYNYNAPIAINEMYMQYKTYLDTSKARQDSLSRARFFEAIRRYCDRKAHGVEFMPILAYLSTTDANRSKKVDSSTAKCYLRRGSSWLTRQFVDEDGHRRFARVLSKNAGDNCATGGAVWFSKIGEEPKSAQEFETLLANYLTQPDPCPCLDDDGNPVTEADWKNWTLLDTDDDAEAKRRAGFRPKFGAAPAATAVPVTLGSSPVTASSSSVTPGSSPVTPVDPLSTQPPGEVATPDLPF